MMRFIVMSICISINCGGGRSPWNGDSGSSIFGISSVESCTAIRTALRSDELQPASSWITRRSCIWPNSLRWTVGVHPGTSLWLHMHYRYRTCNQVSTKRRMVVKQHAITYGGILKTMTFPLVCHSLLITSPRTRRNLRQSNMATGDLLLFANG